MRRVLKPSGLRALATVVVAIVAWVGVRQAARHISPPWGRTASADTPRSPKRLIH